MVASIRDLIRRLRKERRPRGDYKVYYMVRLPDGKAALHPVSDYTFDDNKQTLILTG